MFLLKIGWSELKIWSIVSFFFPIFSVHEEIWFSVVNFTLNCAWRKKKVGPKKIFNHSTSRKLIFFFQKQKKRMYHTWKKKLIYQITNVRCNGSSHEPYKLARSPHLTSLLGPQIGDWYKPMQQIQHWYNKY
jgi:hypothetical protein